MSRLDLVVVRNKKLGKIIYTIQTESFDVLNDRRPGLTTPIAVNNSTIRVTWHRGRVGGKQKLE